MSMKKTLRRWSGAISYRLWKKGKQSVKQLEFPAEFTSLAEGDIAIDAGANVGVVTKVLAANGATVHAFEPDPVAFAELTESCGDLPNVTLHQKAISDRPEGVNLYRHLNHEIDPVRFSQGSSLISDKGNVDDREGLPVEAIDVAAFMQELGGPVKVLKMDIEGSEYKVMERLLDTGMINNIDKIFVETHARRIPSLREADQKLRERIKAEGHTDRVNFNWI